MRLDSTRRRRTAAALRAEWMRLSRWGPPVGDGQPRVDLGRCPIRQAICDPAATVEARPTATIGDARRELGDLITRWPHASPRLAVEGDTGLGKTTFAVERCAEHAVGPGLVAGAILLVVHDKDRVGVVLGLLRQEVARRGGSPGTVADLLGRQPIDLDAGDDWNTRRFACANHRAARRWGERGRRVQAELCEGCRWRPSCEQQGWLRHTKDAESARVVVTTAAKLAGVSKRQWELVAAVVCDEDVTPGLLREFSVFRPDLLRAARYIRARRGRVQSSRRARDLLAVLALVDGTLAALDGLAGARAEPLVLHLPEDCERYATEEGLRELERARPLRSLRAKGGPRGVGPDERAPAEWERLDGARAPRQVWDRLLTALSSDMAVGGGARCATVYLARSPRRTRLHVVRFDKRTLEMLRARPLLLLDATLHPAVAPILGVERRAIQYEQGRTIVQVLGPLLRLADLCDHHGGLLQLTERGGRTVARLAGFVGGRRGYVLCRKALAPLLKAEAARYYELRRVAFVTAKRERGWDADRDAVAFAVVGRHAKNGEACEREARALRSAMHALTGSTAALDALPHQRQALLYRGRAAPVRYVGELVERPTRRLDDPLAAILQDADRVATVSQFIGRDRTHVAEVLLLRGDPTVAIDGLVEERDLPLAVPASERRLVGGRTVPLPRAVRELPK